MTSNVSGPGQESATRSALRRACLIVLGPGLLFGAGCLPMADLERSVPPAALPAPLTTRIPLTVGVHYSLRFRLARPIVANHLWKIGEPSVKLFDTVLPTVFEKVVQVENWPPQGDGPDVAAVIVPRVIGLVAGTTGMTVEYQVELFTPQGDRIGDWIVEGSSAGSSWLPSTQSEKMRRAIRSAGAGLIASFFREPAARKWLVANGITPESVQ